MKEKFHADFDENVKDYVASPSILNSSNHGN